MGRWIFDHDYLVRSELDKVLLQVSKNLNPSIVLDVGCGPKKPYSYLFQDSKYIGLDFNGGDLKGQLYATW